MLTIKLNSHLVEHSETIGTFASMLPEEDISQSKQRNYYPAAKLSYTFSLWPLTFHSLLAQKPESGQVREGSRWFRLPASFRSHSRVGFIRHILWRLLCLFCSVIFCRMRDWTHGLAHAWLLTHTLSTCVGLESPGVFCVFFHSLFSNSQFACNISLFFAELLILSNGWVGHVCTW